MVFGHRFAVLDQDVPKKAIVFFAIGEGFAACKKDCIFGLLTFRIRFRQALGCVFGAGITEVSRTLSSWQREDVHDPCSDHVLDIVGRVA